MKLLGVFLSVAALSKHASALVAFPGAEGFGANAVGARGGSVYVVTTLAASGTGSLMDALSASGRTIVFAVGGVIKLTARVIVPARTTILGQTAPGGGITVYGNSWSFSNSDNTIIRYVRIRMGKGGTSGKDGITIESGDKIIFDHLSVSWGRDETFSINGVAANITIQNSIIAQGLETHSCGGLMQTSGGISLFRNFYIDNKTRNPKVKGVNDFTNNVVYNWGGGGGYIAGDSDGQSYANIIGNYFISGPSTSVTAFTRGNANFHGYVSANYYDSNKNGKLDGISLSAVSSKEVTPGICSTISLTQNSYGGMSIETTKYKYPPPAKFLSASNSVTLAIKSVGASLVRDSIDTRLIRELTSYGTLGQLISDEIASPMFGPGTIASGTKRVDTDGDGIPDSFEISMGWNPNVKDSTNVGRSGYSNVEVWANSLVPSSY